MESLVMRTGFWQNKSVAVTGHTGFKGGWLAHWLSLLGAEVHGFSLPPEKEPSFFTKTNLTEKLKTNCFGDVRDINQIKIFFSQAKPEIVFHLAAQPLVRKSYELPLDTFSTNISGTINLLETVRHTANVNTVINITTDKCYKNQEWTWPYRECDEIGGDDPYSASKSCSEIISHAYRQSYYKQQGVKIATARAGNVIGGGDWAEDRLIPDAFRAIETNTPLMLRAPNSVRPWQHVLAPLDGYMKLAEALYSASKNYEGPWNFGPESLDSVTVLSLIQSLKQLFPSLKFDSSTTDGPAETLMLKLDSSKARKELKWNNKWGLKKSIKETLDWHFSCSNGQNMNDFTSKQIKNYMAS